MLQTDREWWRVPCCIPGRQTKAVRHSGGTLKGTFTRPVVRVKQVTIATGAVVAADVVVTEVIAGQILVIPVTTLVYI